VNLLEINILERLRHGDEKAFEYVFRTYYNHLYRYSKQILKDDNSAEEAVELTFINLWENHENLNIETSIKSYLFKSVFNHCLNFIKHLQVKERYILYLKHHIDADSSGNVVNHEYPLSIVIENELELILEKAINNLPHQCREVFILSRYDNLKNDEIAVKLSISVNTVRTHISRALSKLREDLKEYLG